MIFPHYLIYTRRTLLFSGCFFLLHLPLSGQSLHADQQEEGVLIRVNEKPVLFFQRQEKSKNGSHTRANYIHPLYGLDGEILSEDFPEDHLHHRGIFWAWHQIRYQGEKIADGWDCKDIRWDVQKTRPKIKDTQITLATKTRWKSKHPLLGNKEKAIILENTTITVHNQDTQHRIIDLDIQLTPLVEGLALGGSENEKGYGGFSFRLKLPEDLDFSYQGKPVQPETNAVNAGPWLDVSGTFDQGHKTHVAVLVHPKNPGTKTAWILRKKGSMQNAVFPGREAVALSKANPLRLRYRLILFRDTNKTLDLEDFFQQYGKE